MDRPLVSVVIPTYNRADGLGRVLAAFEVQRPAELPFEVVVVDDGSTDATPDVLTSWRSRRFALRVARQNNAGPAAARNRALALAAGEIVLFGGDDIEPDERLVFEHASEHLRRSDPCAAVLGLTRWPGDMELTSTMRHVDGPGAQQFSYAVFVDGGEYDFRHFYTSNVSLRRAMLRAEPEGFSREFPAAAFEDAELAYRLAGRGMRIFYHRAAEARHRHRYGAHGFFARQVRCGEMAQVLVTLHPELAKWVDVRSLMERRIDLLAARADRRAGVSAIARDLERWEGRAVALAASLDLPATDLVDPLLHALFRYAFLRGLAGARFGEATGRRLAADLWLDLLPRAVSETVEEADRRGVPISRSDAATIVGIGGYGAAA